MTYTKNSSDKSGLVVIFTASSASPIVKRPKAGSETIHWANVPLSCGSTYCKIFGQKIRLNDQKCDEQNDLSHQMTKSLMNRKYHTWCSNQRTTLFTDDSSCSHFQKMCPCSKQHWWGSLTDNVLYEKSKLETIEIVNLNLEWIASTAYLGIGRHPRCRHRFLIFGNIMQDATPTERKHEPNLI